MRAWHLLAMPLIAVCVVVPVVLGRRGSRGHRLLAHPVVAFVGTVSYGAYLWHHIVMYNHVDIELVRAGSAFQAATTMVGVFAFCVALGAGSWFLIERPSLRLAERLTRRR
jgi:peptidoglycan/LPS O-acetylase OafA/YrhL